MNAEQVESDTLTILLANRIHSDLNTKARAIKISKCCKKIRDKTSDELLYDTCRNIITATSSGRYAKVIKSITLAELNYTMNYSGE